MLVTNLSLVNIIYLVTFMPYRHRKMNLIEIFNETCILACLQVQQTMMLSDNPSFSIKMTWVFISVVAANMVLFVILMIYQSFRDCFKRCYMMRIEKRRSDYKKMEFMNTQVINHKKNDIIPPLMPEFAIRYAVLLRLEKERNWMKEHNLDEYFDSLEEEKWYNDCLDGCT
jgi:hypothetical protein